MSTPFTAHFQVLSDFTAIMAPVFSNTRSDSVNHQVSFDVTITNTLPYALTAPIRILFPGLVVSSNGGGSTLLDLDGAIELSQLPGV